MNNRLTNSFACTLLALVPVTLLGIWKLINQPLILENGLIDDSAERSLAMFWHLYLLFFLALFLVLNFFLSYLNLKGKALLLGSIAIAVVSFALVISANATVERRFYFSIVAVGFVIFPLLLGRYARAMIEKHNQKMNANKSTRVI